ncbi:hypothetical protein ZWY2020_048097 [Hordeum vulgare]|nr:hypothetical protein ZWY2020_048097 [Hordeum vulgare]
MSRTSKYLSPFSCYSSTIILGNDAELGSVIDPEEAQKALEIDEANLSKAEGTKDLVEAKLALRRARIRTEAINWIPPAN